MFVEVRLRAATSSRSFLRLRIIFSEALTKMFIKDSSSLKCVHCSRAMTSGTVHRVCVVFRLVLSYCKDA